MNSQVNSKLPSQISITRYSEGLEGVTYKHSTAFWHKSFTYQNLSASERNIGAPRKLFREYHPGVALADATEQTSRGKRQQRARIRRWPLTSRELGLERLAPPTSQTGQDRVFPTSFFSPHLGHWVELIPSSPSLWLAVQCGFGDDPMKPKTRSTNLYPTDSDATENPCKAVQL